MEKSADLSDIKKPGVEATKHTEKEITTLLLENSYKTADLIKAMKAEYGMKESTFCTLWRQVRKKDGVTESDKGAWSYVPPASNPPRISARIQPPEEDHQEASVMPVQDHQPLPSLSPEVRASLGLS